MTKNGTISHFVTPAKAGVQASHGFFNGLLSRRMFQLKLMRSRLVRASLLCLVAGGFIVGTVGLWKGSPVAGEAPGSSSDLSNAGPQDDSAQTEAALRKADLERQLDLLKRELESAGGWEKWRNKVKPFNEDLAGIRDRLKQSGLIAYKGLRGNLFSSFDFRYHLAKSFLYLDGESKTGKYSPPYKVIVDLAKQLKKRNIDLIFIPVPPKSEVCPETLSESNPADVSVSPQRKEFMLGLLKADVEVVDLLPGFLEERKRTGNLLMLEVDTHWNSEGIANAAKQIASRLKRYRFIRDMSPSEKETYSVRRITVRRTSTLVKYMSKEEAALYPSSEWTVDQVLSRNGRPYKDIPDSPVLLIGDSFAGFFSKESGWITAHIAKEIGIPLSLQSTGAGGPSVPRTLARKGRDYVNKRRVIIWLMVSRYLIPGRFSEWRSVKLP